MFVHGQHSSLCCSNRAQFCQRHCAVDVFFGNRIVVNQIGDDLDRLIKQRFLRFTLCSTAAAAIAFTGTAHLESVHHRDKAPT